MPTENCAAETAMGKPCSSKASVKVAGKFYCKRHEEAARQAVELQKIRQGVHREKLPDGTPVNVTVTDSRKGK